MKDRVDRTDEIVHLQRIIAGLKLELAEAKAQLEVERMRLAACGVIALANTRESAANARAMNPEYRSASCDDVARAVDEQMDLRERLASRPEVGLSATMIDFLRGAGPLEGVWFGEPHPTRRGLFWWRELLRDDMTNSPSSTDAASTPQESKP